MVLFRSLSFEHVQCCVRRTDHSRFAFSAESQRLPLAISLGRKKQEMKGRKFILPTCRTIGKIFGEKDGTKSLATAAHVYLDFLLLTGSEWKGWNKRTSEIASERYLAFSKLQEVYPDAVPTRDISIAWCADMLDRPHAVRNGRGMSVEEDEALSGGKPSHRQW